MLSFLEVLDSDIGRLDDAQLKRLVGLIGRAELMRAGLGLSGLWTGGHQSAPDGGSDVHVAWSVGPAALDFAPRRRTEIQCKATSMPASAVTLEMRPAGVARNLFAHLAEEGGAYIIASTETCAVGPLQARREAMRTALHDVVDGEKIVVDFYDAARLAQFSNRYPGVALWVKEAIGEGAVGWRAWGSWSAPGRPGKLDYIADEKPRVLIAPAEKPITTEAAIQLLRTHLAQPGTCARIVGLSGLGKTRFAEALFDPAVGADALSPDIAVYGDVAASPVVSAMDAMDRISRSGERAIVVADNCPHDAHRRMVDLLGGAVSLLTIDFDVDEDRPDRTLVVEVMETGDDLIDTLLKNRVPKLGQVDRRAIVSFSGGNARIALALAATALDGESLANLSEKEMLDRLFLNARRQNEPAMARCAEAGALVYSFNVNEQKEPEAELAVVASWAGVSAEELFRQMAELVDRGLAQKRGPWRAVLPHALAAKLARRGLERVPSSSLLASLKGRPRLFASFCKRLGLLHDIPSAVAVAEQLFSDAGPLGAPARLVGRDLEAFIEMAPAAPDAALAALERSLRGPDGEEVLSRRHSEAWRFARLLRSLAYEEAHFSRAVDLLALMTSRERSHENHNATSNEVEELFHLHLSGTLARPAVRLSWLDRLLAETEPRMRDVGLLALRAMLNAGQFSSSADFTFGARSRNFGWTPKGREDLVAWYGGAVDRVLRLVEAQDPAAEEAMAPLAWAIEALGEAGHLDIIEAAATRIRAVRFWTEGWRALCQVLHHHRATMKPELVERLDALERRLRPTTLADRFTAYVVSENWMEFDPSGKSEGRDWFELPAQIAEQIGREIGTDEVAFATYAPRAVLAKKGQLWAFGLGLYGAAPDAAARWGALLELFRAADGAVRNVDVICGYLHGAAKADRALAQDWLNALEGDAAFAPFLVHMTALVGVEECGLERLRRMVGVAPTWSFKNLMLGRTMEKTAPADFVSLLRDIKALGDEGADVAIDILAMRLFGETPPHAPELLAFAREIVLDLPSHSESDTMRDHHVGQLVEVCLDGGADAPLAQALCERINALADERDADRRSWETVLKVIVETHPDIVLAELLDTDPPRKRTRIESWLTSYQSGGERSRDAPIDRVPVQVFMDWIKVAPERRALIAAELIASTDEVDGALIWSEIALALLAIPDAGGSVARALVHHFWPLHWSNLTGLVKRRALVEQLLTHANACVRDVAPKLLVEVDDWIVKGESATRREDESFE